jgi:predicted PurR-regulated permease PerM
MATQDNAYTPPTPTADPTAGSGDNLLDLVRQLTRQGSHLAEQQIALVQAEIREAVGDLKTSIGGMVGAAVAGIAGLGVVLMGLAYLLGDAIDNTALGTLIVGLVALLVAYLLYNGARKKMDAAHLTPDRTRRTLERTSDMVHGDLHTEQTR